MCDGGKREKRGRLQAESTEATKLTLSNAELRSEEAQLSVASTTECLLLGIELGGDEGKVRAETAATTSTQRLKKEK